MKHSSLRSLVFAILLAVLHGFIYLRVTPPWQHYDEPAHFEYAWLVARNGRLPQPADADRMMRGDLIRSMAANGFFSPPLRAEALETAANPKGKLPQIGHSQLGEVSVYYLLPAAAIALTADASLTAQLAAARASSLILLVVTVICAWAIARLLTPEHHPLRWLTPASLALLPSFVDLMTSVNSDVGAVAMFSIFLWTTTRYLTLNTASRWQRILTMLLMLTTAAACVFVKGTSAAAVLIAVLALIFGSFPPQRRYISWLILIPTTIAALLLAFRGGDAHAWYTTMNSARDQATRCDLPQCAGHIPVGDFAVRVAPRTGKAGRLVQSVPADLTKTAVGRIVTVAGWRWAHSPNLTTRLPWLAADYVDLSSPIAPLSQTPEFFAYRVALPAQMTYLRIVLPGTNAEDVYYDGLMAAVGEWSIAELQQAAVVGGDEIRIDGRIIQNLVRNGSGEQATIAFRPSVLQILDRVTPAWMEWPMGLSALLDLRGSGWYFQLVLKNIFESFWGRFGWGQIAVPNEIFTALMVLTAACVAAAAWALVHVKRAGMFAVAVIFGIAVLGSVIPAMLRGTATAFEHFLWLPGARYVAPVTILLMLMLLHGSVQLLNRFGPAAQRIIPTIVLAELSILSIATVATYYVLSSKSQPSDLFLALLRVLGAANGIP
jgi:hypothetical protein